MYPASFDYVAPASWNEAVTLLAEHGGEAKILAGGCSLIPLLKLRMAEPRTLIDLRRIDARSVTLEDGFVRVGAMTREADIETSTIVAEHCPILAETSRVIADPIVRNMGTVGGNVAHADPANDHPATMLALEAVVVVRGPAGGRTLPIDAFFVDLYATALEPDEVITEIRIPRPPSGTGGAYVKFERQVGDFPIVAVAAQVTVSDGAITAARVGLTNVGPTALRARSTEALLIGREPAPATVATASAAATDGIAPWNELRGSAAYKTELVPVIARRAIDRAIERAVAAQEIHG